MSPIEPAGGSALGRGAHTATQLAFSARSGAEKARSLQSAATSAAAAPVETVQAVAQAQSAQKTRLRAGSQSPPLSASQTALAKPMTAVLLHELRLQQELADIQVEKDKTAS